MCDVPQPSSRRAFGSRDRVTANAMRELVAVRRGRLIAAAIGAALLAVWAAGATWCLFASDTLSAGLLARTTGDEAPGPVDEDGRALDPHVFATVRQAACFCPVEN